MILSAGMGTRLKPLTDFKPKALVEINGRPLLEWNIMNLKKFGFDKIIINIHHFGKQIIDFVKKNNSFGIEIVFSDETNKLLDTGGGIKKASWFLSGDEPFLVHNVDIISNIDLSKMMEFHKSGRALATLAVQNRSSSRYLFFDKNNRLAGWRNEKTGEEIFINNFFKPLKKYAFNGIHILSPEIFDFLEEKGKFSIIKSYLSLAENKKIIAFEHTGNYFADVGKKENIVQAAHIIRKIY